MQIGKLRYQIGIIVNLKKRMQMLSKDVLMSNIWITWSHHTSSGESFLICQLSYIWYCTQNLRRTLSMNINICRPHYSWLYTWTGTNKLFYHVHHHNHRGTEPVLVITKEMCSYIIRHQWYFGKEIIKIIKRYLLIHHRDELSQANL